MSEAKTSTSGSAALAALELLFLLAAGGLALTWGFLSVEAWVANGLVPGARDRSDLWPTWIFVELALFLILSFKRPAPAGSDWPQPGQGFERLASLVLAVVSWALVTDVATDLPIFASAADFGAGPILRPLLLLVGLGLGWYAYAGPVPKLLRKSGFVFEHPLAERALVLFGIWATANGKLFLRESTPGYAVLAIGGLVTVVLLAHGRSARELVGRLKAGMGWPTVALLFSLPLWWWIAGANASAPEHAQRLVWRLIVPALVAAAAAATLGQRGIRRVFGGLVLGVACVLLAGALGLVEALQYCSLEDVLHSRLRLLGLHPNLGAAMLAIGLPLTLGWILAGVRPGLKAPKASVDSCSSPATTVQLPLRRRTMGSLLFAAGATALFLTGSRAGGLGAVLGLGVFPLLLATGVAAKLRTRYLLGCAAAGALLVVLFLSPLGDSARDLLDAKAQTQSALGQRWHIWKMAGSVMADHPWTGIGPVGFSGHAQYAAPSYYDGTTQTLHTHNIFMAAGAGAGWPGLVLFCAWLVAFFGLCFRSVASRKGNRALEVSLVAAASGLLVCNLFDLGQSQLTFLPIFYWLVVGLLGAGLRVCSFPGATEGRPKPPPSSERRAPTKAIAVPLGALLILWPSSGSTLVGLQMMESAARFAAAGDLAASTAQLEIALLPWFDPPRSDARLLLGTRYKKLGRNGLRLASFAKGTQEAPDHSLVWRRYAEALLESGRFAQGAEASLRAYELDPRGALVGQTRMLQAWAAFASGDAEAGSEFLMAGFAGGAKPPKEMSKQRRELKSGAGATKKGLVFQVGTGAEFISLDSILTQLGERLIALASTDEVRARRELTGLIEGYRYDQNPGAAVPWIRGVIEASANPIRATYYQQIEVLIEADREEQARAVWEGADLGNDTNLTGVFSSLFGDYEAESSSEDQATGLDIFFVAGRLVDHYLDLAIRHARFGRRDLAEVWIERALYDCRDLNLRARVSYDFLVAVEGSADERIGDLLRLLEYSSATRKAASHAERFRGAVAALAPAFGGDLGSLRTRVRAALEEGDGFGAAGGNFLIILDQQLAGSTRELTPVGAGGEEP